MPQTPGMLEQIFNSTILWPQQVLWRSWRAATDDQVDFFSEKGIADAAMLPLIGTFANHENDVMPEEMFGEGLGKQIAGSILTDPLFFLTGAYALGGKAMKVGHGMYTALGKPGVSAALNAASKGKGVKHLLANSSAREVKDILRGFVRGGGVVDESIQVERALASGAPFIPALSGPEMKALTKQLNLMEKLGPKALNKTFNTFVEEATKYQIAWGLPILQRFGVRFVPKHMKGYEGWFKYMGDQSGAAASLINSVLPIGGWVAKVPFASAVLDSTFGALSQAKQGWKTGGDTSHGLTRLLTGTDEPEQALKWATKDSHSFFGELSKPGTNATGGVASRFAKNLHASFDNFMATDEVFLKQVASNPKLEKLVAKINEAGGLSKYQKATGRYPKKLIGELHQMIADIEKANPGYLSDKLLNPALKDAFALLGSNKKLRTLGTADDITKRLNPGHDWTAFDEFGEKGGAFFELANKAFGGIGDDIVGKDNFITNMLSGHILNQAGTKPTTLKFKKFLQSSVDDYRKNTAALGSNSPYKPESILTASGEVATSAQKARGELAPIVQSIQGSSYEFGKGARELYNKAFSTGTSASEYKELNNKLKEWVASGGDQVKELGETLFAHGVIAAKELGMEYDELRQVLNLSLQSSFLPEEISHVAKYMASGNIEDTIMATDAVYNGLNRTFRALQILEPMIQSRVVGTAGNGRKPLKALYDVLQKQVYDFSLWADEAIDGVSTRSRLRLDMGSSIENTRHGQKIYDQKFLNQLDVDDKFLTHNMNAADWGEHLAEQRMRGGVILGELESAEVDTLLNAFESANRSKLLGQDREEALQAYLKTEGDNGPLTRFIAKYGGVEPTLAEDILRAEKGAIKPTVAAAKIGGVFFHGSAPAHGAYTGAVKPFKFDPTKPFHVGTREAALDRMTLPRHAPKESGQIFHIEVKPKNPYMPGGKMLSDEEVGELGLFAQKGEYAVNRQKLLDQGYDVVPYINVAEDPGSLSYLILDENALTHWASEVGPKGKYRHGRKSYVAEIIEEIKPTVGLSFDDINTLITRAKGAKGKTDTIHTLKGKTLTVQEITKNLWKTKGWMVGTTEARQLSAARTELAKWSLGISKDQQTGLWKVVAGDTLGMDMGDIDHLSKGDKWNLFRKDLTPEFKPYAGRGEVTLETLENDPRVKSVIQQADKPGRTLRDGTVLKGKPGGTTIELHDDFMAYDAATGKEIEHGISIMVWDEPDSLAKAILKMDTVQRNVYQKGKLLTGKARLDKLQGGPLQAHYLDAKGYSTVKKLMAAAHKLIRTSAGKKRGDVAAFPFGRNLEDIVNVDKPLSVPRQQVVDLMNKLKGAQGAFRGGEKNIDILDALRNRATFFDYDNPINTAQSASDDAFRVIEDYTQLRKLKEFRANDPTGKYNPVKSTWEEWTEASPPRSVTAIEAEVRDTLSGMYKDEEVSEWLESFAKVAAIQDEIHMYVSKAKEGKYLHSAGFQIQPEMLDEMEAGLTRMQEIFNDSLRGALGPVGKQLFDALENTRRGIFVSADAAGTLTPGSPLGYLSRVLNRGPQRRLNKLFSDGIPDDISARLSSRIGNRFARASDHMTVEDLNQFYFELKAMQREGSTNVDHILSEIESIYDGLTNIPGSKYKLTPQMFEDDPLVNVLTSLSRVNQDSAFIDFFDEFLSHGAKNSITAEGVTKAASNVIGGRVIGFYDDNDQMFSFATDKLNLSNKGETKFIHFAEETMELPSNARGVVVEASDGHQFVVDAASLEHSHMSLLPLGKASYGIDTPAKAMVHRLGRAELDGTHILKGDQLNAIAPDLLGQYVVYGAQGPITGAMRSMSSSLEVTPIHWRTFDNVNYMIKAWQTVYRLPFHIANVVSGTFQAGLAGANPLEIMGGYADAMRLMYSKQDFGRLVDMTLAGADLPATSSRGLRILPASDFVRTARRMGYRGAARLSPKQISAAGLDHVEDFYVPNGTGGKVAMSEILIEAAKQQLFGTFSHSGLRASQTTSDTILSIKIRALDPSWLRDNFITRGVKKAGAALGATPGGGGLRETSEILNRIGTVNALVRKGYSVKRAVQLSKNAHVSYDAVTPFEKTWMRRAFLYYTFPRNFFPWASKQFSKHPETLSKISNTIRNDQLFTAAEGRATLKVGDYRVDVGRMAASVEATTFFAAFFDKIGMPIAEKIGGRPFDAYRLERELSTAGIFAPGGLTGTLIPLRTILPSRDHNQTGNFMDQAIKMVYPIKYMAQMMGLQPSKEEQSPYVQYTDMDKFITNSDFGLGVRKVRPQHETLMAYRGFQSYYNKLKLRIAASEPGPHRERLIENVHYLAKSLKDMAEREQKAIFPSSGLTL